MSNLYAKRKRRSSCGLRCTGSFDSERPGRLTLLLKPTLNPCVAGTSSRPSKLRRQSRCHGKTGGEVEPATALQVLFPAYCAFGHNSDARLLNRPNETSI